VADSAIGVGASCPPPLHAHLPKMWPPPGRKFQTVGYMNHCHLDPVNTCLPNMRNSLFRLLILFEVFDKLQFSAPPWNSWCPLTQQNLNPPLLKWPAWNCRWQHSWILSFRDVPCQLSRGWADPNEDRLLRTQESRTLCQDQLRLHRLLRKRARLPGP